MSADASEKTANYLELEGLRGWMAFWVFVTHVTTMATLPLEKGSGWGRLLADGSIAVGTFIMISGFVIALSLHRRPTPDDFFIRRALRIFPVYLVGLFLSVLVLDLSIDFLQNMPWDAPRRLDRLAYLQDSADNFWLHLALHIPLLHGLVPESLLPSTSYAFMGQGWSLTLEWQFYLVAPLLYAAVRARGALVHLGVFAGLVVLSQYLRQGSFLPSYLWLFYVGILFQLVVSATEPRQRAMLLAVCAAAFVVALWRRQPAVSYLLFFLALGSAAGMLPSWGARVVKAVLCNRFSTWLGHVSYAFYCIHMVAIFVTAWFIVDVLGVSSRPLYAVSLIVGSLAIALAVSHLLGKWVEQPCIRLGKRIVAARAARRRAGMQEQSLMEGVRS
ncbi:acyltransferase family protein [Uliginosibacterium sp. H1]|uniref:acyltransferase family protein n=1 Tax=Uliginosibacterium sp. H1 TaxID=3114757 RepID=UPI002E18F430|nr:acyltransferase [Uliginosibacterium sp. H1]